MTNDNLNLQRFIILIVIVGVTLVIGIYISDTISDAVDTDNTPITVVNETGAWINGTGYTLAQAGLKNFAGASITVAYNGSNNEIIPVGNYTVTGAGVLSNLTAIVFGNVSVSYTATYSAATNASSAADDVTTALATGTSWISILVVVGFATVILTMLTAGLGQAAQKDAATPYY